MSRIVALGFALAVFLVPTIANAQCKRPPEPCVCDFAGPTALHVQNVEQPDGGFAWIILEQSGQPLADAGVLDSVLASFDKESEHLVSLRDGALLGSARVLGENEFFCESSNADFSADRPKVLAAMTSSDCFAAMADAGVPKPPPNFECHDTGMRCDLGGSTAPVALAVAGLVMTIVRRRRRIH